MAFDFKKAYKEYYLPKGEPSIVDVPEYHFIAVRGQGDPNAPDGDYQRALNALYAVAYTLKMSGRSDRRIEGFFDHTLDNRLVQHGKHFLGDGFCCRQKARAHTCCGNDCLH